MKKTLRALLKTLGYDPSRFRYESKNYESYTFVERITDKKLVLYR